MAFPYRGDSVTPSWMDVVGRNRRFGSGVARWEDELGRSAVPKDLFKRVGSLLIDCERVLLRTSITRPANQHRFNCGGHPTSVVTTFAATSLNTAEQEGPVSGEYPICTAKTTRTFLSLSSIA